VAESNAAMANNSAIAQKKGRRPKTEQQPAWKFEIIYEESDPEENLRSNLRRNLAPFLEAAHDALGAIYAAGAKRVLERKEEFEDRRAERKARQRGNAVRPAKLAIPASEIRLSEVGTGLKNGLASSSKSRA
jgi:hypothetical protein